MSMLSGWLRRGSRRRWAGRSERKERKEARGKDQVWEASVQLVRALSVL
jgi:hypothetical protein